MVIGPADLPLVLFWGYNCSMATFNDIQTRVQRRLIDLPTSTLAEVPELVNDALRELQSRHNFKVMEKLLDANTAALTRNLVAVPADFKEARLYPYFTPFSGKPVELELAASRQSMNQIYEPGDDGAPAFILHSEPSDLGAAFFEVWPLSNSQSDYSAAPTGEYRVTIPYYRWLPALVLAADNNWFTNDLHGALFIINQATGYGFAMNWDVEKEAEWLALAEKEFQLISKQDKMQRLATVDTLVPLRHGVFQPRVRK